MTDTSKMANLETVKKEIRALLISSQRGVPLCNFPDDYYEVVGMPLDFTDLGFFDLETFLQAIPDVVCIVEDSDGQKILKHVSDESTKHIEKLVERQKPNGNNSGKRTRKARGSASLSGACHNPLSPNGYQPQYQNHPSCRSLNQSRNNTTPNNNNNNRLLPPSPFSNNTNLSSGFNRRSGVSNSDSVVSPSSKCLSSSRVRPSNSGGEITSFRRPSLPNFIRVQIQQTLASFSEPVSQSVFEAAYKKNFGASLNFEKCGFGSIHELLQSIPETLKISQKNGEPCYKLAPNTMSDQRGRTSPFSPKTNFSSSPLHYTSLQPHSPKQFGFQPLPSNVLQTSPLHSKPLHASMSGGSASSSSGYPYLANSSPMHNKKYKDSRRSPTAMVSPNNFVREMNDADDIVDLWIDDFEMSINPDVTQKIEKVLKKHPNGLYASMLCVEYQKIHGQDLDYRELGYLSVIELVSKLKSVRIVRPTVSGDWLLFDAQKPFAAVEKIVDQIKLLEVSKTSLVKEREKEVRLNISKMLETIPEGVNLDQFMEYYKKITGDYFQPDDVGFKSLESYILSLASNIVEISYTGNACLTIKSIKIAKQENAAASVMSHNPPKLKTEVFNSCAQLPEDAVGPGVSYRLLDIVTNGQYIEVFVSNIETPGNFWIQFRGRQHSIALEKLMDDLETLYCSSEANAYQVPDDFIRVGLVGVAIYPEDQNWHRILITSVPNLSYVEVYFVDYGNTCIVARKSLRLLKRSFLNLPMQAIQARLANVKPIGDRWTINARNRMLKLCSNRPLVALVTKVKDRVMSLCLIDTSETNVDIHINDHLVKEEYCYFSPDDVGDTKSPGTAKVESSYHSNSDSPVSTGVYSPNPKIQSQQFQPITLKPEHQEERDPAIKPDKSKPSVNRPTSIHRESPSVSPTFGTNTLKQKQNSALKNLTLNSSNNFQRHENIARPTSISTSSSSCLNQVKMTGKTSDNSFILHCGSVNNHVPKIDYPISKGNNLKPFVKKVQLTDDYAIHVFNFNGTACISSCDLSAFLWKIDIVRTMLRTVNLGISKVIICEEDYSELFSELKRINFSGLWDGEERKDWVTLFQLEDVPVVLETFNHPSAELKLAVQLAIRNFDPNDEFWRGKCKETPIENTTQSTQPLCKQSSPKPIPSRSISQKQSPTVYSEQTSLSSSASPPQFHFGKGSPSQRNELRTSSAESSPRSRRPSTVTLEDIKTINANLTHLHKLRQCILNKMEKANCPYENYAATLASVESKLQKLNALLIKASPTVENKDPPGQGRLLSPYQQNSSNVRRTPSPAGNLGFSPRDTRSAFQSPSPSPTQFDSWGERKSIWPQLRPFLASQNQRLYSPPSFPLKVPESTPLTPQVLSQMLDSQYAALFAASGMSATPSDPLVAVNNSSYSSGVSSCTSSNLNTPASPFSPNRNSPPSRDSYTSGVNHSSSSPRLLPGLYPLLHQQSSLTCLGRGSSISSLSISPPMWPGSVSPSPGFMSHTHSPSRNLPFSPSPSSQHSLSSSKGHI